MHSDEESVDFNALEVELNEDSYLTQSSEMDSVTILDDLEPIDSEPATTSAVLLQRLKTSWPFLIVVFVFLVLVGFVFIAPIFFPSFKSSDNGRKPAKNMIFMVSDGFGPSMATFARDMAQQKMLVLDSILVGTVRTKSADSLITDSAAGATAFASGIHTDNGMVGVYPDGRIADTILEAAKRAGKRTGLVVTSSIPHATPAAFTSHVDYREKYDEIASQQAKLCPDIMVGGGKQYYIPSSPEYPHGRKDGRNLTREMESSCKAHVAFDTQTLKGLKSFPILGLLADNHIPYVIDRPNDKSLSLPQLVKQALALLSDHNDKGFFLLIEGSRIDHAAHANDPQALFDEIMEYQETVQVVKDFMDKDQETRMFSVSDHDTGALGLGADHAIPPKEKYQWYPEVIRRFTVSCTSLAKTVLAENGDFKKVLMEAGKVTPTAAESVLLEKAVNDRSVYGIAKMLGRVIARAAGITWVTYGHSASDVNLYSYGYIDQEFHNLENTDLTGMMADTLHVKLQSPSTHK